jgi:hypothetical protein
MQKGKERIVEIDTQIKEKIGFASIVYDRIYVINKAFDSEDKGRLREALHTCFDSITPYLNRKQKSDLNKKITELEDITNKKEFIKEAHKINQSLLKVLRNKDMLVKEIQTTLG